MTEANEAVDICLLIEGFGDETWLEDIKKYKNSGGDINAKCGEWGGTTLLHQAAARQRTSIAQWLMSSGADINSRDENGNTPLHEAVEAEIEEYMSGQVNSLEFKVTKKLFEMGADKLAKNNDGKSPYDIKDDYLDDAVDEAIDKVFGDSI